MESIRPQRFGVQEIHIPAKRDETPADFADCSAIVAPEISDRLEVRSELTSQPDQLEIACTLPLQADAITEPVKLLTNGIVAFVRGGARQALFACH
jgi:hypothetical protein